MADISLKKVILDNGETMAYREREGGQKQIVLVHGNMTSSVHWDLVMENLPAEYKVYAVDMRGFGESTYNEPIYSLHDFALDLRDWVDKVKLTSFVLVGWSTGGGVAMDFAADYPDYVEKLILLASVGTRGYPLFKKNGLGQPDFTTPLRTKEEIAQDPVQVVPIQNAYDSRNKGMLRQVWNLAIYTHNQPDEARYEKYLDDMLTQRNLVDVDYALATFNISGEENVVGPGSGKAAKINIPVLVLRGTRDYVIPDQMAKDIKQDIGDNARIHYLEDAGHSPLIDALPELLQAITDFIKE
ncbi:intracellular short-chain-length polyhydroxyalkanoate depolymerase [Aneurinibacillus tyrosinisolvens]|uniref:intracellular short-chain-length polyhydroxyalkanoate depolymerase n=1 Tax=Aneurinibacillus tyrosinisolvens TaxID=1443435 RepID=UPI00063FA2B8|nr:alpha/beta hydrolase [Aneurinibacillus tyrosinisolvens]